MEVRNLGSRILESSILEEQIELETEAVARGVARYNRLKEEAIARGDAAGLKPVERLLLYWFEAVTQAITVEQDSCASGAPSKGRALYGPVLRCLDPERLAVIAMHEMLGLTISEPTGVKTVSLTYAVGSSVIAEIHWDMLKKTKRSTLADLDKKFKRLTTGRRNWWAKKHLDDHLWNRRVCTHVGARLIQIVMQLATCAPNYGEDFVPAFRRQRRATRNHKMPGVIGLTDAAKHIIHEGHMIRQNMRPRYLPMIVPPYPWSEEHEGGYVRIRTPFISKPTREQSKAIQETSVTSIYESVNALGEVPWRINDFMFDHLVSEWDDGGNSGGLPPRDNRPMPERPEDICTNAEALKLWKCDATEIHQINHRASSRRVEFMSMLSAAETMADRAFYLPHQICWRSRAYPIPVHLNHHGGDAPRSIMLFDRPVELTDSGWRQILIHTANRWGMDKVSYDERVAWTEENFDHIIASARDPREHRWWTEADTPQQFLAACMACDKLEIAERLPVSVDGTCNGLQHYAGMSLNQSDCASVNLAPGESPADVYTDVLRVVLDRITAEFGQFDGMPELAVQVLDRKTIKQPVMTTVYGVTRIGARSQIQDSLRDLDDLPREQQFKLSEYLSHRVITGLGEVCVGAGEIMDWIRTAAKAVLDEYPNDVLRWTSALGFPVVQPYRNFKSHRITTCLQEVTYAAECGDMPAMRRKQIQGAPANRVHTEDASHMHGTALRCKDEAIDFAEVHDSYWAHAENMPRVHELLREEFVELHRDSRVQALHDEWSQFYPSADLPAVPDRGSFDIEQVMASQYFFN